MLGQLCERTGLLDVLGEGNVGVATVMHNGAVECR